MVLNWAGIPCEKELRIGRRRRGRETKRAEEAIVFKRKREAASIKENNNRSKAQTEGGKGEGEKTHDAAPCSNTPNAGNN